MPTKAELVVELEKVNQEKERLNLDIVDYKANIKGLNRAILEIQVDEDNWDSKYEALETDTQNKIDELEKEVDALSEENGNINLKEPNFIDNEISVMCSALLGGFNKGQGNRIEFSNFLELMFDRYNILRP